MKEDSEKKKEMQRVVVCLPCQRQRLNESLSVNRLPATPACKTNDAERKWRQWTQILTVVNTRRNDAMRDDHVGESTTGKPPHGPEGAAKRGLNSMHTQRTVGTIKNVPTV